MYAFQEFGVNKKPKFYRSVKDSYEDEEFLKATAIRRGEKLLKLPCGQCIECRLAKSAEWADRCYLEMKYHSENCFVTLTYKQEELIYGATECATILRSEIQKFNKRLLSWIRYNMPGKEREIKFKYCGEYGDKKGRPHYHEIIFGFDFPDKKFLFKNELGQPIYTSKILSKLWKKGISSVAEASWESCAYVSRYIMKKQTGKNKAIYESLGIEPEFTGQSTRPAIGKQYYEENKEKIYENDGIYILKKGRVRKAKPPRYFDKLFDLEEKEYMQAIKRRRKKNGETKLRQELEKTDLDYKTYMENKEYLQETKVKALKRNYEAGQI